MTSPESIFYKRNSPGVHALKTDQRCVPQNSNKKYSSATKNSHRSGYTQQELILTSGFNISRSNWKTEKSAYILFVLSFYLMVR